MSNVGMLGLFLTLLVILFSLFAIVRTVIDHKREIQDAEFRADMWKNEVKNQAHKTIKYNDDPCVPHYGLSSGTSYSYGTFLGDGTWCYPSASVSYPEHLKYTEIRNPNYVACSHCQQRNSLNEFYCQQCGAPL